MNIYNYIYIHTCLGTSLPSMMPGSTNETHPKTPRFRFKVPLVKVTSAAEVSMEKTQGGPTA